ncbi:DUF86 domain-containing protein [Parabacteroides acidifaciens]|uniref:DUF86 domain-containing protein n=1 Tax=Parabacteroides acidifaciens TaxID=2290935 RepID=A0ABR7NXE3_9BACT|nr:HepT-like ribonuclease domain-containing protein [Parabacteroides acidifaciens]MBC8600764.1 DUF86 domain-containing protein [Parabacteroides acidifaciens]
MHKDEIIDRLSLIVEAIDVITDRCTEIQTPDDFLTTPWGMTIFDSCVMRLQTIGEYVKKVDDKTNKQLLPKYPQVPWIKIIGQRNIISHEYSTVDEEKIFITIKKHLPPLKSTVLLIIKDLESNPRSLE